MAGAACLDTVSKGKTRFFVTFNAPAQSTVTTSTFSRTRPNTRHFKSNNLAAAI